jgi:hypothetical protein
MNKKHKLAECTQFGRKRIQMQQKYKFCFVNMWLEVFIEQICFRVG